MPENLEQHNQLAEDLVAVYNTADENAVVRLNDLFHSSLNIEQIRQFVRDRLSDLPDVEQHLPLADAKLLFARLYGFKDWAEVVRSSNEPQRDLRSEGVVWSSRPPFYRIDWTNKSIQPCQPMSNKDWESLFYVVKELGLTAVNSDHLIGDEDLEKLAQLDQVTSLDLSGSQRITDKGLQYLARMPQLRELKLNQYPGGLVTDRGLEALQHLRELRVFQMCWQSGITDEGISNLRFCDQLEEVDLLGTNTGDGAIAALTGKPRLRHLKTGRNVTDDGLPLLHQFPAFKTWQGGEVEYGLMSFGAEPTNLLIDGPFSSEGLASLRGLDGVFGLSFFWHTSHLRGDDLQSLAGLSNLGYLGCGSELCDDDAMRHIAALPKLRMLMGQGTVATDEGFRSLSQSQTIEYIWGRECPNLKGPGFAALAGMRALKGLAVSCKFVDDDALAMLPDFPALRELMPMDVGDDGFRHIGRCRQLESLVLMYCRDTTDVATEHIQTLSNLKKYHAGYTRITDRSLEMLSRMTSLEELSFEGCKGITDTGVALLATLPHLRKISIGNSRKVTRKGMSVFTSNVRVNYDAR
jgi:Leucine Rich repeat